VKKLALASAMLAAAGCRGSVSEDPPIHIIPDMDWQDKYHPQGESALFADGRAMRDPVEGTVARGSLKDDEAFYRGTQGGQFIAKAPIEKAQAALKVDSFDKLLDRGQQRFNIYCAPCHDQTGGGNGLVTQAHRPNGYPKPIDLASEHPLSIGDGEIFSYISNGIRNMPGYAHQIPEADRWAIVAWVRVLQRSQHASIADVPEQKRDGIEAEDAK
jgi:mono/diheme cytochrome c family protein